MRAGSVVICFAACLFLCGAVVAKDLSKECSDNLQKVTACLDFVTGKEKTPTKECCSSVKEIKGSQPQCLCFIIQQVHSGNDMVKSLGIQEAKLLQLPSACALTNATASDCPKLLGLDPKSPDAAIFSGNSSSSAAPATAGTTTAAPTKVDDSDGTNHGPSLAAPLMIALVMSLCAFPPGFASVF
ncbi:non-specific lipid transfer protein GPI-anchored 1 [Tripterygium wilfordii]|uniref:Non-specific lipid transfer protein GPI-anchored 1 n=2 Tax=Tripterygium wilfordii TaxID=458696 RepID=A0A7J7D4C1_TRIWF|nr:non-specific lipid transfer protein GPI-anchored 1 [Tripterygium wilfordii]